jgi:hypothetical protein
MTASPIGARRSSAVWPLRLSALAPISHYGDERAGNQSLLRRIAIQTAEGRALVPVISGNALRGQLRRLAARTLLDLAGIERVPAPIYHLLFSGGALTQTDHAHRIADHRELRALLPVLGLFGGALGAEIIPGALRVDILWPVCRETVDLTGVPSEIPLHALTDSIYYTRRDDLAGQRSADDLASESTQMIYEGEAVVPGTGFRGALRVIRATDAEVGCLALAVAAWLDDPRLGGLSARGHGRLAVELDGPIPHADCYRAHVEAHGAPIRDRLLAP